MQEIVDVSPDSSRIQLAWPVLTLPALVPATAQSLLFRELEAGSTPRESQLSAPRSGSDLGTEVTRIEFFQPVPALVRP